MIPDHKLISLVKSQGTPLYVYDLDDVKARITRWKDDLSEVDPFYAMKANRHPAILKLMLEAGFGVDCASVHEARIALEAGFPADRIMVTQCGFSDDDLSWLIGEGLTPVLGSLDEIGAYIACGGRAPVFVRVNGGVGSGSHSHIQTAGSFAKFGVWHERLSEAIERLRVAGVALIGLHQSVGSDIHDADAFIKASGALSRLAKKHGVSTIDIGGGITPSQDLQALRPVLDAADGLSVRMEPGRFFVARSGALLCRVQAVKRTDKACFCIVDTGMQHFVRPSMYGANHPIRSLTSSNDPEPMIVAGNACENGDILSMDEDMRSVPLGVRRGDLLVIGDVGAYGITMASSYCGYPLPEEAPVLTREAVVRD